MSSSIWTQCAGDSKVSRLRQSPWRVVEAQHLVSTRKLVDTIDEQAILEQLIETSKPTDVSAAGRHVLLATPFRYPPLRHGSRFGARRDPSLWYGSAEQRTLFAEAAYYRLLFLEGTSADLGVVTTWHTAFRVSARTERGIDLTTPPFDRHRAAISSPSDYRESQALGQAMRAANVGMFRWHSARDAEGGVNVGIFTPAVFGTAKPRDLETWHAVATRERVEFVRRDWTVGRVFAFPRAQFTVGGALPTPGV